MSTEIAAAFTACLFRRRYRAGQWIYSQGDDGTEMFRILEGSVRMSIKRSDGREVVLVLFQPGDCFGDSSLIDGEPRPQSTEALTDVLVDVIERTRFDALRVNCHGFDAVLLKLLARQMRIVSEHFGTSNLDGLHSRVAARVMVAMHSFGVRHEDGIRLSIRLSQTELATMVGASRQAVNRVLRKFQADGVIHIEYGNLLVLEPATLASIANSNLSRKLSA